MSHFNHLLIHSALVLLLVMLAVPPAMAQAQHEPESNVLIEKPDVVMHVQGLACGMCARSVMNALGKVDAVQDVQVLLEDDQRVLITLKDGKKADEKTLREAVTNAGFSTRKVIFAEQDTKESTS